MWRILKKLKLTRTEIIIVFAVTFMSCMIVIPSLLKCIVNKGRGACENHIYKIMHVLSDELAEEEQSGGTYWHDIINRGDYRRLLDYANAKTGESKKFPSSDYYAKADGSSLTIYCKKHPNMPEKTLKFASMPNVSPGTAQPDGRQILFLSVDVPDRYYVNQSLDKTNPKKMVFRGYEADEFIKNIEVTAVYTDRTTEILPRGCYSVLTKELDMSKAGAQTMVIKTSLNRLWAGSVSATFEIDVHDR